jgi:hypothetical protein
MPRTINIVLSDDPASRFEGQLLLIVPMTPEELDFLGAATAAQADFIAARTAEIVALVEDAAALGTVDAATLERLRQARDGACDLAKAALVIRDILQRRLIVSQGKDSLWAGQWGRA